MLAAGIQGVEGRYVPPEPVEANVHELSPEDREKAGIKSLPGSLLEAIAFAEESDMLKAALGEHLFKSFIKNKKIEWETYSRHVTDYEIKRYLPIL